MPFPKQPSVVPTDIGAITVTLIDLPADGDTPAQQLARYDIAVLDATGQAIAVRAGDLLPQLTGAQRSQLSAFLTALRAQAVAQILP